VQILENLDIQTEYAALGVQFVEGQEPNAFGWLSCRAVGRDDLHPSAGVNIGMGPARGRYKDFGGDQVSLGLFDFAAKYGPCADWKAAREYYAVKSGVSKPRCEESNNRDVFGPMSQPGMASCHLYAESKPGVLSEAVASTGAHEAVYSYRYPMQLRQSVLVWRFWGPAGLDAEPIGYHASRYDGEKISIHQRNKSEPDRVKTLSKGSIGLLNDWCLRHYRDAEVIWLVEGLSDMIVMQGLLGVTNVQHLVTTMGGASARLNAQLVNVFAGKQVFVLYDRDDAGEKGAFENAARLASICDVRIVRLPEQGQDLRDWVQLGNDYHHLFLLADQSQQVVPGSQEVEQAVEQQEQSLIRDLGGRVIARSNTTGRIALWNGTGRRLHWLDGLNWMGYYDLCLCFSGDEFMARIAERAADMEEGQLALRDLKREIARAADRCPQVDETKCWKVGCWLHGDDMLLVNGRTADVCTGHGIEAVDEPIWGDQIIEYPADHRDWYDRSMLAACYAASSQQSWRQQCMQEFEGWFQQFSNWTRPYSPSLLAACLASSFLETVWPLRPHIAITGQTNTGKSTLIESFIKPLYGSLCISMLAPTEAAVRQECNSGANVILIDEFDTAGDQASLLEMARAGTRKQSISRGSRTGKVIRYPIQHSFYLTGVGLEKYLTSIVDRNRFLLLSLEPFTVGSSHAPCPPSEGECVEMRHKMLAIVLSGRKQIVQMIAEIERLPWVEGRLPQVYALPVAVLAYCYGWTVDQSREYLEGLLADVEDEVGRTIAESSNANMALSRILLQQVRLPRGGVATVHEFMSSGFVADLDNTPYGQEMISHLGIRKHVSPDGQDMVFISPTMVSHAIGRREAITAPSSIRSSLSAVSGAVSGIQILCGSRKRGVSVPLEACLCAIEGLTDDVPDDEPTPENRQGNDTFVIELDDDF
jgi:hypothetical protein